MRVDEHPILGTAEKGRPVTIFFNGNPVPAFEGESIAAALIASGIDVFRRTSRFESPRSVFCGIGQCSDCSMTVDGIPNVRTCVTQVREGLVIVSDPADGEVR